MEFYEYIEGETFSEHFLWTTDGQPVDLTGYSGNLAVRGKSNVASLFPVEFGSFEIDGEAFTIRCEFVVDLEEGDYFTQLQIVSPQGQEEYWNLCKLRVEDKL